MDIVAGTGPVMERPFAGLADLGRLRPPGAEELAHVSEAVRLLVAELDVPLIGFAGAPFTLASYVIEGGPSRHHPRTKAMMLGDPGLWFDLTDRLADVAIASLRDQVAAGAAAVQLFDSWAGCLSPEHYRRYAAPAGRRVLAAVAELDVPAIHFGVGTGALLEDMATGADVVGIDWRVPLDAARTRLGPGAWRCRATSTLPPAWRPGRWWPPRPAPSWPPTPAGRGTSSTSATASCPRPTRRSFSGWSTWCTREGRAAER